MARPRRRVQEDTVQEAIRRSRQVVPQPDDFSVVQTIMGMGRPPMGVPGSGVETSDDASQILAARVFNPHPVQPSPPLTNDAQAILAASIFGRSRGGGGGAGGAVLTLGTYLTGGSYSGVAPVTVAVDATSANTASKIVARDSSGDFSAGTITGVEALKAKTANMTNAAQLTELSDANTYGVLTFNDDASSGGCMGMFATAAATLFLNVPTGKSIYFAVNGVAGATINVGNVVLLAGKGLFATLGGGAPYAGTATLVGGTVTVNTTAAITASLVFLTRKSSGGTIGTAITYTINSGVSFTINSDNPLDTSTFVWMIVGTI